MAILRSLLLLLLLMVWAQGASACTEGHVGSPPGVATAHDQLPCAHGANCCECQIAFAEDIAPAFESHKAVPAGSAAAAQVPQSVIAGLVGTVGDSRGIAPPPPNLALFLITSRLRL